MAGSVCVCIRKRHSEKGAFEMDTTRRAEKHYVLVDKKTECNLPRPVKFLLSTGVDFPLRDTAASIIPKL